MAFTKKQQSQIRELAHAYSAYITAKAVKDEKKIKLWADILMDKQQRYGVEVIEEFYLSATLADLEG